jgi:alpha-L-fucosidase
MKATFKDESAGQGCAGRELGMSDREEAMAISRRRLVQTAAASLAAAGPARGRDRRADWELLAARKRTPDWFRDAKLGIWAHWGPQCVPEFGDWYGRLMYVQGNPFYEHHVSTYGHPSRFGFMELINRWRAEHWDPEGLLDLYQGAGAKYFVALANHHDNFDTFASSHHDWNALNVGPRRDIIGTWAAAVRGRGLPFGVSNHSSHAWHWWQTAYGYDAEGPLAGERYDAWRLRKQDGAGKWWAGLDPQKLYTGPHMAPPDGLKSIGAMNAWHDAHDGAWIEDPPPHDPAFVQGWSLRCRELIDRYRPDLIYFDDTGLPLGQAGIDMAAYYYEASDRWSGGMRQGVATGKKLNALQRRGITEDVERGFSDTLRPEPWQTDTCIGDWHYNRGRFENHYYVPAKAVIQRLADVVSKNGNLLLSIPLRGDGTIDADEQAILLDMAAWMKVNGEAIFATRPWRIYGEGPTRPPAGSQNEQSARPFTAQDIRFTTKGRELYALAMEWPADGVLNIRALANAPVERVELLGFGQVAFEKGPDALAIRLPAARPVAFVPAFRILGPGP